MSDNPTIPKPIVAIGLLTEDDLIRLGSNFDRAWPVDRATCFEGLLEAIDEADRAVWRARDAGTNAERAKQELRLTTIKPRKA